MSFRRFFLIVALVTAPAGARAIVGTFAAWGAFCDEPRRCFALSQPAERERRPFVAILIAGRDRIVRAHVGRTVQKAELRVGDRSFRLSPRGEDAVADVRTSRQIIAAIREANMMSIRGTAAEGTRFRHHYDLAGAPSAIDAAALAAIS